MTDAILSENARARLEEIRQQIRANAKANPPKRTFSLETRQKMSLSAKIAAENMSPETKQKMREKMSLAAKNRSPEVKQKMIEQMSQILTCIHCGKIGKGIWMYRHHFNNCKHKG